MNRTYYFTVILSIFLVTSISSSGNGKLLYNGLQLNQGSNGVVVIDDTHNNDYSNGNLASLYDDLESLGYLPYYISEFSSWDEAFDFANYLIMNAPYTDLTTSEITTLKEWAESGTRGMLISSRGDFSDISHTSMNTMFAELGADVRVQDDNIESTNPVGSAWSISSSNIQNSIPALVSGVTQVAMFSPTSLRFVASTASVIVYGDGDEYQNNNNPPDPHTWYDNTDDGVNGESIPLISAEDINLGTSGDKLVVAGTTMWSDFDYPSNLNNIDFLRNTINYFKDHIISTEGSVPLNVPESGGPSINIISPRADSFVKGTVEISVEVTDRVTISEVELYIDDVLKSSTNKYTWDTTTETEGEHVIKIVATNVDGQSSTISRTVTVNQDFVPQINPIGKVMEYNIERGGLDPDWIEVMKEEDADIAILVETGGWDDNNNEILNQHINTLNDYFHDEVNYQGVADKDEGDTSGVVILSRYPINSANEITEVTLDDGTSIAPSHDFMHVDLQIGDVEVAVIGGHLKAFEGDDNVWKREKAQEGIINYMDELGDVPIIYASDMNSHYPGEDNGLGVGPVSMLIDPSHEFSSTIHTFVDVHKTLNPSEEGDTYETGSRIDFIFVNQHMDDLIQESTTADTLSGRLGSDHFSVDVTIDFSSFGVTLTTPTSTTTDTSETDTTTSDTKSDADGLPFLSGFFGLLVILIPIILRKKFKR